MGVDPLREIEELVHFEGRWPGTDAERRAAVHLQQKLMRMDREAELEPIQVRPNFPVVYALLAVLAVAGSVVSVKSAIAGVIILLVVTLLTLADLMSTFMPVRAIVPRRASQNVISREDGGKAGTLVLVAHYDAARTGALFGRRVQERNAKLGKLLRRSIGPFEPFFWSMVVILVCAVLRLIGFDNVPLTVVQFIPTVVLIASVPLLADIALSDVVPGANDNASAVATVTRLAERYGGALEHFDVWVLLPGAEEGLVLGSRAWIRRHKKELDPASTVFLNLESVGYGTVRWATKEGFVFPLAYHPTLVGLCGEIAEADEDGRYGARGLVLRGLTDGYSMRSAGFPSLTLLCLNEIDYFPYYHQHTDTPENIEPEALERVFGFCCELVELIDQRVGPDLERGVDETVLSESQPD
jgi:Peptidase family M28